MVVRREFCNGYAVEVELTHEELETAAEEYQREKDEMVKRIKEKIREREVTRQVKNTIANMTNEEASEFIRRIMTDTSM